MNLYIMRHSAAEDYNTGGDKARCLTDIGMEKAKKMGDFLYEKIRPRIIMSSPYKRAMQTAEIVTDCLKLDAKSIIKADSFTPDSDVENSFIELNAYYGKDILVFGHNPHLSDLCSSIIGGQYNVIQLKKGSLICLKCDGKISRGSGYLQWMVTTNLVG